MFEHIIVAVDGSKAADHAVTAGCELASRCNAQVTLMHVRGRYHQRSVSPDLRAYAESEHLDLTGDELIRIEGEKILTDAQAHAAQAGVRTETVLAIGDPATCIVDQAREQHADLVVMGQRGLGSLGALLMGSVSHKVAQLAPCACLVIK
jgi:nucleotide-binding universal stress UspA family protein